MIAQRTQRVEGVVARVDWRGWLHRPSSLRPPELRPERIEIPRRVADRSHGCQAVDSASAAHGSAPFLVFLNTAKVVGLPVKTTPHCSFPPKSSADCFAFSRSELGKASLNCSIDRHSTSSGARSSRIIQRRVNGIVE